MKKKNFVTLIMSTVGGILFALGIFGAIVLSLAMIAGVTITAIRVSEDRY